MIAFTFAAFLATKPTITAVVGNRIYADKAPQGITGARIVYRVTGGEKTYHTRGPSGLVEAGISLTFHANKGGDIATALAAYEAVRNQIDGFQGTMGTTAIDRCVIGQPAYGSALPTQGDEVGSPAVNAMVHLHYLQAAPTGVAP